MKLLLLLLGTSADQFRGCMYTVTELYNEGLRRLGQVCVVGNRLRVSHPKLIRFYKKSYCNYLQTRSLYCFDRQANQISFTNPGEGGLENWRYATASFSRQGKTISYRK